MKKAIAWLVAWILFWLGHLVSLLMHQSNWLALLYIVYNKLMTLSSNVQDWGGAGPWKSPQQK